MKTWWRFTLLFAFCIGLLGGSFPRPALASAPSAETPALEVTLKDLGYGDLSLRGMYGTAQVWVPFRSDWAFNTSASLEITYQASPLLKERSTLTVVANDLEIASIHPTADGQPHTITAVIPVERLQGKGLSLRFRAYLRLTDQACEETNNPGQWLTITADTRLILHPLLKEATPDLAHMADLMVVSGAQDYLSEPPPPLLFVLPDDPTATELSVASQVAARLANASNFLPPIEVVAASAFDPQAAKDAQVILVGTPARQPWLQEHGNQLPAPWVGSGFAVIQDAQGRIAPPEHGVIQMLVAPWNSARYVLVVSGGSEEGLRRAGEAFAHRRTFAALQGDYLFVSAPLPEVDPLPPLAWTTDVTTFAQLGESDRRSNGAGVHQEYFFFRRPPGWVLDKGAQLVLRYTTSPALTSREAYIAVFINDIPVGSVRTGPDFSQTEIAFDLPVARLNRSLSGQVSPKLTVRLEVGNFAREAECEQVHPEADWTIIRADSYFYTPHVYYTLPDLQSFPYPFVGTEVTAPSLVLLPPQPTATEIGQALSVAALLGQYTPVDFPLQIATAAQVDENKLQDANVMVMGSRDRQPLIDTLLEQMGAIPGYRGEAGLYRALETPKQGILREGPSPWNSDRIALLAFGTTETGFENAIQALLTQVPPVDEAGSVALVNEDGQARIIYRAVEQVPAPAPAEVQREPVIPPPKPWMVITGIIVLTALVIWGVVLFARWRYGRKGEEEG